MDIFGVITAACSRALRQAEAYSSRVQVMLTMVSIDATVGLNEELSRSLSLAREILELKFALKVVCGLARERPGSGLALAKFSSIDHVSVVSMIPPRLSICTVRAVTIG